MLKEGTWWLKSKSDPRWDAEGRGSVGMFAVPTGAEEAIEKKKAELKEEPPDDLEYGYMKD